MQEEDGPDATASWYVFRSEVQDQSLTDDTYSVRSSALSYLLWRPGPAFAGNYMAPIGTPAAGIFPQQAGFAPMGQQLQAAYPQMNGMGATTLAHGPIRWHAVSWAFVPGLRFGRSSAADP